MAKLFMAGDTHGSLGHFNYLIKMAQEQGLNEIYQLGDFGYWEHTERGYNFLTQLNNKLADAGMKLYWLDGNHEAFEKLYEDYDADTPTEHLIRPNIFHMGRGYVKEIGGKNVMFLGGAYSVDKNDRALFIDYWREELITQEQMARAIEAGAKVDIDIMLTHDAPEGDYLIGRVFPAHSEFWGDVSESLKNRENLAEVVFAVKPKVIVHGHYHFRYEDTFKAWNWPYNKFSCKIYGLHCDMEKDNSWMVFDTDKMEKE